MTGDHITGQQCKDRETQGEYHMTTKAEITVIKLQARKTKDDWQTTRNQEGMLKNSPTKFQREKGPLDALISDFQPGELEDHGFLLF